MTSDHSSHWLLPYGTLMTILMVFFLLLYAYTYLAGGVNYERVVASIAKGFGRSIPYEEVALAEVIEEYFSRKKEVIESFNLDSHRINLVFNIPIFFEGNSHRLKKSAVEILKNLVIILKDMPNEIVIEGYASGEEASVLSARRALEVGRFFIEEGIDPYRIILKGWGSSSPLWEGDKKRFNERIEISILRDVSPLTPPGSPRLVKMKELFYYGEYYLKKGDSEEAKKYFSEILKIDPSHWKARSIIKKIDSRPKN